MVLFISNVKTFLIFVSHQKETRVKNPSLSILIKCLIKIMWLTGSVALILSVFTVPHHSANVKQRNQSL